MRTFKIVLLPILALLLVSSFSVSCHAIELSESVKFVKGVTRPYWQSSHNETKHQGALNFSNNGDYQNSTWIRLFDNDGSSLSVAGGNYVSITATVTLSGSATGNASTNVFSQPTGVWGVSSATASNGVDCHIIDINDTYIEDYDSSSGYEYRYIVEWICRATGTTSITNPVTNFWIKTNPANGVSFASLNVQRVTVWEQKGDIDLSQVISRINAVNTNITTLNGKIDSTNNKLNTTNSNLNTLIQKAQDMADAQEEYNQQQQQQYEAEKQEESDREDSIDGQSSDAQSLFNFEVLNPFSGIFNLFNTNCSAQIPTIAKWLHSSRVTYTSWWCPNIGNPPVRGTLTPVFGIASMMLLFGFVVRWLSNNSGDIYGARNFNKELNG